MDYNERISQCDVDIERLKNKRARLVKEQIERKSEKRFYIGEIFPASYNDVRTDYMLVKLFNGTVQTSVALIALDGRYKGESKHHTTQIPIFKDADGREYTKYLPTFVPSDFGLDKKYGWSY